MTSQHSNEYVWFKDPAGHPYPVAAPVINFSPAAERLIDRIMEDDM